MVQGVKGKAFDALGSRQVTNVKRLFLRGSARRHALVGPARLWQMKRQFQIDFLVRSGLQPSSSLLDLGCGTLRGGIPLIEFLDEGRYAGVDVRPDAMVEALRELADHGLASKRPNLLCVRDLGQLRLRDEYDVVWAFSVLIHLADEQLADALSFVSSHLRPGGQLLANVNLGEAADGRWEGFPVVRRSLGFYRDAAGARGLDVEDLGTLASLGHRSGVASQDGGHMLRFTPKDAR
jgi:SAM-dependent methyltransferase